MHWWSRRREREDDLERELSTHLQAEAEEQAEQGVTTNEAGFAARRAFGNVTAAKEDVRAMWGWNWVERIIWDFRYSYRTLRHSPGFGITAVLSLALGIGASTSIFTVVNSVLLRPLPFPESERLVQVWETKPSKGNFNNVVNPFNFLDWRDRTRSFEGMAAVSSRSMNLTALGNPVALDGMEVSANCFSILGVSPALGRAFLPQEGLPGHEYVVILGFGLWQSRFGGDRHVLGRKIMVDGEPHTVVGVTPLGFTLPKAQSEIWKPLPLVRSKELERGRYLQVIARLKHGVHLEQAKDDLQRVASQLATERPDSDQGWSADAVPMLADATATVRLPLLVLLAAVGILLLIACANVANLLLMRASGRLHEVSLRAALGASKIRLLQQMLSESFLLVFVACLIGLAIAYGGVKALLILIPNQTYLPRLDVVQMDSRVFLFAVCLSILTALLVGLAPWLQVSQIQPQSTLQLGSMRSTAKSAFRKALVVLEIALSLVLLVGAGLMLRSFNRLISVNPGFETQRVLTMGLLTSPARYRDDQKRSNYFASMLDQIRSVPGVQAAGSVHFLPLQERISGSCFSRAAEPPPRPSSALGAQFLVASPGYVEALKIPVLAGRAFNQRDGYNERSVIMVNAQFAKQFLSDRNPIGQKLQLCWTVKNPAEIVGVVADARQAELKTPPKPTIFVNNLQAPMYFAQLTIRTSADPSQMTRAVEAAIHRVDPDQAVTKIETFDQILSHSVTQPRLQLVLLMVFGTIAGLLAMVGVYGVVSYSVAQRTREIGIRMALGAQASKVRWTILREGAMLAALGAGVGLAGALMLTRVLRTMLFETAPSDPLIFVSITAVMLLIVLLATGIPAHRAAKMNPMISLRHE